MMDIGTLGGAYAQAICDQRRWVHHRHVPNQGMGHVTTHAFIYRPTASP